MNVLAIPIETAPRVSGPPQGQWTYADWEKLDHGEFRFEIIEGFLYVTTPPRSFHQWIVMRVYDGLGSPRPEAEHCLCLRRPDWRDHAGLQSRSA